jgi:pimeloyl-ACP methyl ester carboxylesterase
VAVFFRAPIGDRSLVGDGRSRLLALLAVFVLLVAGCTAADETGDAGATEDTGGVAASDAAAGGEGAAPAGTFVHATWRFGAPDDPPSFPATSATQERADFGRWALSELGLVDRITQPVLMINGKLDHLAPIGNIYFMLESGPPTGRQAQVYADAGHCAFKYFAEWAPAAFAWLAGHLSGGHAVGGQPSVVSRRWSDSMISWCDGGRDPVAWRRPLTEHRAATTFQTIAPPTASRVCHV